MSRAQVRFVVAGAIGWPSDRRLQAGTPLLTCESDGYAVSPSFLRQVDVHIQQMLEHAARTRG